MIRDNVIFDKEKQGKYVFSFLFVFVLIVIYSKYRCYNPNFNPLETKTGLGMELDGWSITHFLFYLYLGYTFPDYIIVSFIVGCIWELLEYYLSKTNPTWLKNFGNCNNFNISTDPDEWWYAKFSDLIVNGLGLYIGYNIQLYNIQLYN